jgi:hypothetical protein
MGYLSIRLYLLIKICNRCNFYKNRYSNNNKYLHSAFINLLLLHDYNYAVVKKILRAKKLLVSLHLLRTKLVDFSYNIMSTAYLLVCACDFACFIIFNNLVNNKLWI